MTLQPPPQMYAVSGPGLTPSSASEVNYNVGHHLRTFISIQEMIKHDSDGLAPLDLKADPYNMTPEDETLIKSAINGLNASLQTVDMTFINRLTGLW
jgi:hypothetical protein